MQRRQVNQVYYDMEGSIMNRVLLDNFHLIQPYDTQKKNFFFLGNKDFKRTGMMYIENDVDDKIRLCISMIYYQ
jgi:hypothetical protein